jgi:hypothetical protein
MEVSFTSRRFTPGDRAPVINWIGGCVDPRAGLDYMEKSRLRETRNTCITQAMKPLDKHPLGDRERDERIDSRYKIK